ncbi:lymphatic vessel endothelial hyaluronic receptor 1b [Hoplias malabaricus]|uniref:lymphatic vessel endothelial hyaluronic receptor 1b n=1 Tax=Hoplias malabaricus TaxID=27720 RepID=UPI003462FB24
MKPTVGSTLASTLLSLVLCTVGLDPNQTKVYPENGGISGVSMVMLKDKAYSFNATVAAEVCMSLRVRIATKAEVETAHSNGLQTCRFGWIKEQIAVIPRIVANEKCGQKRVGVITWAVPVSRPFEVFCFNTSGQAKATTRTTPRMTTAEDRGPRDKTTSPSLIQSTLFNTNILSTSSSAPSSFVFSSPVSSTFVYSTVSSAATSSPPSLSSSTSHNPLSTSSSAPATSFSPSILSSHPLTFFPFINTSSNQTEQPVHPPPTESFGEVPTACLIIVAVLVLMAVAGAVWYFQVKRTQLLPPWVRIGHKDMVETEMWKHTDQRHSSKQKKKNNFSDNIILQLEEDIEEEEESP